MEERTSVSHARSPLERVDKKTTNTNKIRISFFDRVSLKIGRYHGRDAGTGRDVITDGRRRQRRGRVHFVVERFLRRPSIPAIIEFVILFLRSTI